jgi:hypothetical protein
MKREARVREIAQILEDFLDEKGNDFDWDDFTHGTPLRDQRLESIRVRCAGLTQEFPPEKPSEYCNERARSNPGVYRAAQKGIGLVLNAGSVRLQGLKPRSFASNYIAALRNSGSTKGATYKAPQRLKPHGFVCSMRHG